jgi:hypothetical protein
MADRVTALSNLAVGDMVHGRSPNGASLICLVTAVTASTICARRITTQQDHQFDRETGIELGDVPSRIDCVAPLPPDVYDAFFALDQRYRALLQMERDGIGIDRTQARWTPEERRAFQLLDEHVAANPI